jgi:hypothetical protein
MAATAARAAIKRPTSDSSRLDLELDPIARGVVFPSHVRDVRRAKGYDTLRDLDGKVKVGGSAVTYNRLAKIERGEVVPDASEITGIAKALKVPVDELLVDPTSPMFDRTAWARDHIEASLKNRGGDVEAMKLGAAMRVHRLSMKMSTSDLRKDFGLPAATASRIENAERPLDRWPRDVRNGIARFFGVDGFRKVEERVRIMFEAGDLTAMLSELFSENAVEARNNRKIKSLLDKLPGTAARKIAEHLDERYTRLPDVLRTTARSRHLDVVLNGGHDGQQPADDGVASEAPEAGDDVETKGTDDMAVVGARLLGNRITLEADTGTLVRRPGGVGPDAFAMRVDVSTVGERVQRGSVLVAEEGHAVAAGDLVVIRDGFDNSAMVALAVADADGLFFETRNPSGSISQSELTQDEVVSKVMAILMPA